MKRDWEKEFQDFMGNAKPGDIDIPVEYNDLKAFITQTHLELLEALDKWQEGRRINIPLEDFEPSLRQYEPRGSAPFYCSLCGESEMTIMDNKTEDGNYFCRCSYWSDPHNAYLDKSGGKWLGWIDSKKALEMVKGLPIEENFINQTLSDLSAYLQGMIEELKKKA